MELSNVHMLTLTLILIVSIPNLVRAQFSSFNYSFCSDTTYSQGSTYQSNLQQVLNYLSTDTRITYGFYNFTVGHEPDKVSSLAVCRGDVPVNTCRVCMRQAASLLPQVCPNNIEAFGYTTYCSVFISNRSIYGKVQDVSPWFNISNQNVPNAAVGFTDSLDLLMKSLQKKAASGNSELKYAAGKVNLTGGLVLYGLVQCTPDLSRLSCMKCIQVILTEFRPWCCLMPEFTVSGFKMAQQSCFAQYDVNPFFGNVSNLPMPRPLVSRPSYNISSNSTPDGTNEKSRNVGAISIGLGVSVIFVLSIAFIILTRRKRSRKSPVKFSKDEIEALQSLQFSFGTIKLATKNFSDDHKLGQGGFGTVYKGELVDGQEIAVKRLLKKSGQGDVEFKNEILLLAKLRHRNLVRLLGYCLHGKEMILVYEFVANRSLDYFIFDSMKRQSMLWETRFKIIIGIARGILYLHEGSRLKIIHRDLKAGNVLLDADFDPKIADFGMARLFNIDQTQTFASKIVGTLGYISPEYALQRQVSVKSDVYSFGVLVLEILSGQKITSFMYEKNQENLLSFAWRNWMEGSTRNLIDPQLLSTGSINEILRCVHIGLLCVQENPADRPTISLVDLMLGRNSVTLQLPSQPAFFTHSNCLFGMHSQASSRTGGSVNFVSISELHPR